MSDVQQLHDRGTVVGDGHLLPVEDKLVHASGSQGGPHRIHHGLDEEAGRETLHTSNKSDQILVRSPYHDIDLSGRHAPSSYLALALGSVGRKWLGSVSCSLFPI